MENQNTDLISIIIPFYNEENYFANCIHSVINQTYKNIEIIIINDASDFHYNEILSKIQKLDLNRIKIINHKSTLGAGEARNTGIKFANGNYIALIDSDDEWLTHKLEYQLNVMKKRKLDFLHSSYYAVDEREYCRGLYVAKDMNYKTLINSCDIGLSTVMIKSNLCKKVLFGDLGTKEDYIYWLRLSKIISTLPADDEFVAIYRIKEKSLSSKNFIKIKNAFKVYYKYEKISFFHSVLNTLKLSLYWLKKKIIAKNFSKKYPLNLKFIEKIKDLNFTKSFIVVALNMASIAYMRLLYTDSSKIIFWIDGIFGSVVTGYKKIPGRDIISNLVLPKEIKNIYLCGNESKLQKNFLKKKFDKPIKLIKIPFIVDYKDIKKINDEYENDSVILINIATPKQEILAKNILQNNRNKKLFIFCLGGGISMACGEEKPVPKIFYNMSLEWLWRLREKTFIRLKRLIFTFILSFPKLMMNKYLKEFKLLKYIR